MIDLEVRPTIEYADDSTQRRYSAISELSDSKFQALFEAWNQLHALLAGFSGEMSINEFLKLVSNEADMRGMLDQFSKQG